jgi:hypothetical protein
MNFDQVISHFGTQQKTANALGLSQSSIAEWKKNGIPEGRQFQIQVITGGALRAAPERKRQAA